MAPTDAPATEKSTSNVRIFGGAGRRKLQANVVAHGHVSAETCEAVFRSACSSWGIGGSSAQSRDDLVSALAEVFVHGTSSAIDWAVVKFMYGGTELSMNVFHDAASKDIGYVNPIRVWVRNFRNAEVAFRIHEFLNDPANVALRTTAAANYGTTVDNARFCFDTANALFNSGIVLSHTEVAMIRSLSNAVINRAQEDAVSRGFAAAEPQHNGTVGGEKPTPQILPPATTPSERGGFKSFR